MDGYKKAIPGLISRFSLYAMDSEIIHLVVVAYRQQGTFVRRMLKKLLPNIAFISIFIFFNNK